MKPIRIKVTEADAIVTQAPTITAGMTGLMAEFEFDEAWEGFTKTAVFKVGDVVRDVVGIDASCKVPPEVLVLPYRTLRIGVYGVSADGEVVIPTVWAAVDEIRLGADPSGDESTEPTLPVWQQILNKVNSCVKTVNGTAPDENGNVQVEAGGDSFIIDTEGYIQAVEGVYSIDFNGVIDNGEYKTAFSYDDLANAVISERRYIALHFWDGDVIYHRFAFARLEHDAKEVYFHGMYPTGESPMTLLELCVNASGKINSVKKIHAQSDYEMLTKEET